MATLGSEAKSLPGGAKIMINVHNSNLNHKNIFWEETTFRGQMQKSRKAKNYQLKMKAKK